MPQLSKHGYMGVLKQAGGYQMGNITWCMTEKPPAWHRFWVRLTLGWIWKDV